MKTLLRKLLMTVLLPFSLAACSGDGTTGVSYTAYNHTDKSVVSIIINGEGGVLHAPKHAGGAEVCCVVIPDKWHPGLKATIKWQLDGHWVRDKNGNIIEKDGSKQFVEGIWKEKTVDVMQYDKPARLQIHFEPGDQVKVIVSKYDPWAPESPVHYPDME